MVTRYFGGILLGTGGLLRAYTRSAKDALDAAASPRSVSGPRRWWNAHTPCWSGSSWRLPPPQGILGEVSYGAQVRLPALLPVEHWPAYAARITELTAGKIAAEKLGETFQAAPVEAR